MKLQFLTLLAAGLLLSCAGHAENYAGAGVGASWNGGHAVTNGQKYDMETFSTLWSLFAGTIIPTEWTDIRVEGEFLRMDVEPDYGRTRQFKALMANATAIIPDTGWFAEPYVGFGLGYARWDHNNTIAGQIIGGVEYDFAQWPVGAALEYRHLWVNEKGGKGYDTSRINSDTLMLKLKYFF